MALMGFLTSWPTPEVSLPDRSHAARQFQFGLDRLDRFQIVQRHQCAESLCVSSS